MAKDSSTSVMSVRFEGDADQLLKAVAKATGGMDKLKVKINETNGKGSRSGGGLKGVLGTLKNIAPAVGAAFTVDAIGRFTTDVVRLGSQLDGIERAFQGIAFEGKTSLSELQRATMGTVSNFDLMQKAVMARNFKIPLENLAELFRFATIRAQQTGESADYLVNSIVLGIGRKSPLILDNLGITLVRLKEAMGKVGRESATVADITAAAVKIAREEIEVLEALGMTAETAANKLSKISSAWKNVKAGLGQELTSSAILDSLGEMAEGVSLREVAEGLAKATGYAGSLEDVLMQIDSTLVNIKTNSGDAMTRVGLSKSTTKEVNDMVQAVEVLEEKVSQLNEEARSNLAKMFEGLGSDSLKIMARSGDFGNMIEGLVGGDEFAIKRYQQAMSELINSVSAEEFKARQEAKKAREKRVSDQLADLKARFSAEEDFRAFEAIKAAEMAESLAEKKKALQEINKIQEDGNLSLEDMFLLAEAEEVLQKSILDILKAQADEEARKAQEQRKYLEQLSETEKRLFDENMGDELAGAQASLDLAGGDVGQLEALRESLSLMDAGSMSAENRARHSQLMLDTEMAIVEAYRQQGTELQKNSEISAKNFQDMANAFQQIHQAMTAIMGVVGDESGFAKFVQGFGKVVTVVSAAAGALAAFRTLSGDLGAAGTAVAVATGVAATIAGLAGMSSGGGGSVGSFKDGYYGRSPMDENMNRGWAVRGTDINLSSSRASRFDARTLGG